MEGGGPRSGRGRRSARASGDERERAIMQTAERLLRERGIGEISVDDLARGAGISRSAFYFYFPSKDAVVLSLIDRMVEQAASAREEASTLAGDPAADCRASIEIFYEIFGAHRAVVRAASDLNATNPEARALWSQIMESWVVEVTERIVEERGRGAAVASVPARDLAIALVQMNEGVLRALFVEEDPAVSEEHAIEVLSHVWLSAIFGMA